MRRFLAWGLALCGLAAAGLAIWSYQQVASLAVARITDDVHVIQGFGGNVAVLRTERGAAVVDTMNFRMQGDAIRERAESLAGGEVQVILNTHYHRDHTHGNPAFPGGTRVVATERTLEHMRALDADYFSGAAAETLPNETSGAEHEIRLGGKTIRAIHPGRGHTDGDLVVLFVEDRVIHVGDLYFQGRYPSVDLEAGGSVRAWIDTLDRVLALDGWERAIPGHGAVSDRAGVEQFQRFLRELWREVEAAARAGRSLEETLATVRLTEDAGYEVTSLPFVYRLDRDSAVRSAWEEATGAVAKRAERGSGAGRGGRG